MVRRFFYKYGMKLGVGRFVASETLDGTVEKVKELNRQGLAVTLDYLGESVTDAGLAEEAANMVLRVLETIDRNRLDANVSVKLTQLGLLIDPALCSANMERIVTEAKSRGSFVWIDMEDSKVTSDTLGIYKGLLKRFGSRFVGIVIQSYLYRSIPDIRELGRLGAPIRIVKGAYKEPPEVAYPDKKDVDASYLKLARLHMGNGNYTAIATHDVSIVAEIKRYVRERGMGTDQFEFQMLYGISAGLQRQLAEEGYRVRVYTPFGEHWFPYFTRRIAERPANLWFVAKNLLRR
nr:proline dehydrogenase family protein [Paenibacillus hamazuiensis]